VKTAATVALRAVPRAALALPPAWRRRLALVLLLGAAFASGYFLWFRDSSFATVQTVRISGLAGPQADEIRRALVEAGRGMTTLHVREASLRDAVARFPVVRAVSARGDFPHALRVQVELNLPVALLQTPAGRLPVAADGLVLRDSPITPGLPLLAGSAGVPARRLGAGRAFGQLRVVASAPEPLRSRITSVELVAGSGLVAHLRSGPDLIFGDASQLGAKWVAASRVLAAAAARGASYVDLRLPERPAAGGLSAAGVLPLAPAGPVDAAPVPGSTATPTPTTTGTTTAPSTTTTSTSTTPAPTGTAPAATPQSTAAPQSTAPRQPSATTTQPPPAQPKQTAPATTGGGIQSPG
jgi:cell division protein FtsQ